MTSPQINWPILNWKEIGLAVEQIKPRIQGLFIDRMIIPERTRFPEGYTKSEWAIRFTGKHSDGCFFWSIRPKQTYFAYTAGKGPKASTLATHSPFSLFVSKSLKGGRVLDFEALPRERIVIVWVTAEGSRPEVRRLGLVLCLIPAHPEALLIEELGKEPGKWKILARSRTAELQSDHELFEVPSGANAPLSPPVREDLVQSADSLYNQIESLLNQQAYLLRIQASITSLKDKLQLAQDRIRQSKTALKEAQSEPDYHRQGEALKAALYNLPPPSAHPKGHCWKVPDYEALEADGSPGWIEVVIDPRLTPSQQVEKFFHFARRKSRRMEEASTRAHQAEENRNRWKAALDEVQTLSQSDTPQWQSLEKAELSFNPLAQAKKFKEKSNQSLGRVAGWMGKIFSSKDGLPILVGRNRTENLELTFKHARGNDLWLHLRGKPGSHAIIPLSSKQSAPLETLLDAAHLVIHYSGGDKWGKADVDYTYKKHVRRIKDSTEASYHHNKTLVIEIDPKRLQRLLGSES